MREFQELYDCYLKNFSKNHDESSSPVCYDEFVDNEIPYYQEEYRDYLKGIVEDENFCVEETEDFYTWVEEEINYCEELKK